MITLKAVILGIVQGLTEFLPISSSGHLVLGHHLFGMKDPELLFDVILHLGTLAAVFIVFRNEIKDLFFELFRAPRYFRSMESLKEAWSENPVFRMLALIVIGSIPTGLLGVIFKDFFESLFSSTLGVGVSLLFTGLVLMLTSRVKQDGKSIKDVKTVDALVIGLAQGLAITPGVSRSGFTISAGLFMGLERELAARYSFLLSIPAILGALILQLKSSTSGIFDIVSLGAGFLAALFSGLLALYFLIRLVKKGKLHYFSYYCWIVGLTAIIVNLTAD